MYDEEIGAFTIGPISNHNMDAFFGTYSCILSHPEVSFTDKATTIVSKCSKLHNIYTNVYIMYMIVWYKLIATLIKVK